MDKSILSVVISSNRKTLIISFGALLFLSLINWASANYFINALSGPYPKTNQELFAITDYAKENERYVQVSGDIVYDSGFTQIEQRIDKKTKRVQSENTVGYYQLLLLDDKFDKFLVLYSENQDSSTQRVGELTALSYDIRKEIVQSVEIEDGEWLLPYMLDTSPYSTFAFIGLVLIIPATILALFNLANALRRYLDPTKHPIYRAAEAEMLWLDEHQGTEYGNIAPTCESCNYHKKLVHSSYSSNVSYFFKRTESTVLGNYCFACNSKLFLRFTLTTLIGTWWGFIGFFVGPIFIIQNLYNYFRVLLKSLRHA